MPRKCRPSVYNKYKECNSNYRRESCPTAPRCSSNSNICNKLTFKSRINCRSVVSTNRLVLIKKKIKICRRNPTVPTQHTPTVIQRCRKANQKKADRTQECKV